MPDPSYGLIVEGPYDGPVFEELVHKIIPAAEVFPPIVCGGVPNLKRKFPGWLRYFERVKQGEPVAKALVIRDSGGKDPWSRSSPQGSRGKRSPFQGASNSAS